MLLKKRLLILLTVLFTFWTGGCRYLFPEWVGRLSYWEVNPSNPFKRIRKIAVIPFINFTDHELNTLDLAQSMEREFANFEGFQVVPTRQAEQVRIQHRIPLNSAANVRKLGRLLRVDAVVVCSVFEYDPYGYPRYGVTLQLYPTSLLDHDYVDIESLSRAGLPFALPESTRERPLIGFTELFDAHSRFLRGKLKGYADARLGEIEPMGYEKYLKVTDEFTRFCHHLLIRELCSREEKRQELREELITRKKRGGE